MRRSVGGAVLAVLVLAACAGDAEDAAVETDAVPAADASAADTMAGGIQTTPAEAGAETLQATLSDDAVTLGRTNVQAGLVSLNVTNSGSTPHRFVLSGNGEEIETDELAPGADVMMTMNLSAGTYQASCSMDGHSHGAAVSLTVQ